MFKLSNILLATLVSLVIAACGGGSDGDGGYSPAPTPTTLLPNFQSIQDNVLTKSCAIPGCHLGVNAPHGLQLSAGMSYGLLVNVDSAEVPALKRVQPFNPDSSYIIQKLEGTATVGQRMPRGQPALPQSTINVIRQWITEGALPAVGSTPTPTPSPEPTPTYITTTTGNLVMVVSSPAANSTFQESPRQIAIVFNKDVDVNTLDNNYFELKASGLDNSFNDGNETMVRAKTVSVPDGNPRTVLLDFSHVKLGNDYYQLSIKHYGGTAIQDYSANRLEQVYVIRFSVE